MTSDMRRLGNRNQKIGRNALCPCGSGRKFKRCHGNSHFELPFLIAQSKIEKHIQAEAQRLIEERRASELQRRRQQGLGRPIISIEHRGYRFVAVGNRTYHSKSWKTFADFLGDYIRMTIGSEWGNAELKKPHAERHPILKWYHHICELQQAHLKKPGEVFATPMTGAISAYLRLAYNLYLIAHNVHEIQSRLLGRLRDHDNFQGAYYELKVAADLIQAGFELQYECEEDRSSTHCEFTATFSRTGRKFSVEAKSRPIAQSSNKGKQLRVGRQLNGALEKSAKFDRLVFIDINRPAGTTRDEVEKLINKAVAIIKRSEKRSVSGKQAPEAYICLTNHVDQYHLNDAEGIGVAVFLGFKIPDFGEGATFESIRAALRAREKHVEVSELMKSMGEHTELPTTFDGQLPSVAFGDPKTPRLVIGQRYLIPDSNGKDVPAVLTTATIDAAKRQVIGAYQLPSGESVIATCPVTPAELEDYQRHPDTFFGVHRKQGRKVDGPMEIFDFFFDSYKDTPRERLLDLLKDATDIEDVRHLPQKDLAEILCERYTYNVLQRGR